MEIIAPGMRGELRIQRAGHWVAAAGSASQLRALAGCTCPGGPRHSPWPAWAYSCTWQVSAADCILPLMLTTNLVVHLSCDVALEGCPCLNTAEA